MVKLKSLSLATAAAFVLLVEFAIADNPPPLKGNLPVTGPPHPDGGAWTAENTPPRLEIRELAKDETARTLFMLALQRMQDPSNAAGDPRTVMDSYWRIAALHGEPIQLQWGKESRKTGQYSSYCYHEHALFPPWHRPYLALYEQTIVKNALAIAKTWDGENADGPWTKAAKKLRLPYWDWAKPLGADEAAVPDIVTAPKFQYKDNTHANKEIPNPLFEYIFPGAHPNAPTPEEQWKNYLLETIPDDPLHFSDKTLRGDNYLENMKNIQSMLSNRVYHLLTDAGQTYARFSNRIVEVKNSVDSTQATVTYLSIEGIHDQIHGAFNGGLGKPGHMFDPATASWDPIFWLHHANVDRLLALWQKANPTLWFTPSKKKGADDNGDTGAMRPFFKDADSTTVWNAADVKDTKTFGYVYNDVASEEAFITAKNRYMTQVPVGILAAAEGETGNKVIKRQGGNGATATTPDLTAIPDVKAVKANLPKILSAPHTFTDYNVNIKLPDTAFKESTTINVFLGAAPAANSNMATWAQQKSFVGYVNIWTGGMGPGMEMSGADIGGSIPLTNALMQLVISSSSSGLKDMLPATVAAYLRRNMKVMISDPLKAGAIDPKSVKSLTITVSGTETTYDPKGKTQPKVGTPKMVYQYLTV